MIKQKQIKYYTYIHKRLDGSIFYVGKGCRNRAYTRYYRNSNWHIEANKGYEIEIVNDNLLEKDAYALEKKLILYYGIDNLTNIDKGGKSIKPIDENLERLKAKLDTLFNLIYIKHNIHKLIKDESIKEQLLLLNQLSKWN